MNIGEKMRRLRQQKRIAKGSLLPLINSIQQSVNHEGYNVSQEQVREAIERVISKGT